MNKPYAGTPKYRSHNAAAAGAVTLKEPSGIVKIAAGQSSIVLTNPHIKKTSRLLCTLATNDATAKSACAVVNAAGGSATITVNANATAGIDVFFVIVDVA